MAGYSDKSLVQKLGYKPGDSVQLHQAPDWFKKELVENAIALVESDPIWLHAFFNKKSEINDFLKTFGQHLPVKGLWVCRPKQSSGVKTDIVEETFRDLILPMSWVDVKICAIDDIWSGMLFYRRKN